MAKYIPLDALVAEIERLKDDYLKHIRDKFYAEWSRGTLDNILSFLDTLEVKEVDLEKELKEDWLFADKTEVDCLECMCLTDEMFVSLAKKYFELGLKAQKGK